MQARALVFLAIRSIIGVARFGSPRQFGLLWLASAEMREMTSVGTFERQLNGDCTARVKALVVWRGYARRGGCFVFTY